MKYRGYIDRADEESLLGWAVDENGESCELRLLVNEVERARFQSNDQRLDLLASEISKGSGGFQFDFGRYLEAGKNIVEVRFPDSTPVPGGPVLRTLASPTAEQGIFRGHVDIRQPDNVEGWAVAHDGAACELRVRVNGVIRVVGPSDRPREDLKKLGISLGAGGFTFDLSSWVSEGPSTVEVLFQDGSQVPGSPFELGSQAPHENAGSPMAAKAEAKAVNSQSSAATTPLASKSAGQGKPAKPKSLKVVRPPGGRERLPSLAELDELSLDDISLAVGSGLVKFPPLDPPPEPPIAFDDPEATEEAASHSRSGPGTEATTWFKRLYRRLVG